MEQKHKFKSFAQIDYLFYVCKPVVNLLLRKICIIVIN